MTDGIDRFFSYARERHAIYLRRRAFLPGPWTTDAILRQYSFTNVFRELDKTTVWFRENVRSKITKPQTLLLATVLFRWFNRIKTGEAIFTVPVNMSGTETAWDQFCETQDFDALKQHILNYCENGPYVTGAYIIKTPDGYSKLDGVLRCIEWFMEDRHDYPGDVATAQMGFRDVAELLSVNGTWPRPSMRFGSLEQTWEWLRQFRFLGDFMAYEIVTDLRHTPMLDWAPDIMTWANPGPGATRGLGRVWENDKDVFDQRRDKLQLIQYMRVLLERSQDAGFWPQSIWTSDGMKEDHIEYSDNCEYDKQFQAKGDWPAWEMRDVEHTLCEFDKYERVRLGEGRPRGRFKG